MAKLIFITFIYLFNLILIQSNKKMKSKYIIDAQKTFISMTPESKKFSKVLFFMHGLGDSADSFVPVFEQFSPKDYKIVLLNAEVTPVTLNGGMKMPSWYDIYSLEHRLEGENVSKDDVVNSSKRIMSFVEQEVKLVGNDYSKIYLAGFSQGGCMSLYLGLSSEKKFGGLLSLSGVLFPFTPINKENSDTPIFLGHGKMDFMIPYDLSTISYQPLIDKSKSIFKTVYHKSYNMEHSISPEELSDVLDFLTKH